MHLLDRPVWSSLTTAHAALSLGGPQAKRYLPDVNVFAATGSETPEDLDALAALLEPGAQVYLLQVPVIAVPQGCTAVKRASGVQMVAQRLLPEAASWDGIVPLDSRDASEMLELATLTAPGPFLEHTYRMGEFFGIRIEGRLAAMAGERFRFPGYTEVSGVCTHPDFRGRGLARKLSAAVAARIQERGEVPFLHAWATNAGAIGL